MIACCRSTRTWRSARFATLAPHDGVDELLWLVTTTDIHGTTITRLTLVDVGHPNFGTAGEIIFSAVGVCSSTYELIASKGHRDVRVKGNCEEEGGPPRVDTYRWRKGGWLDRR
jgi:hypothetical protein